MTRLPVRSDRRLPWVEGERRSLSLEVGADLKRARLALGLSSRAAARRVGVSDRYVYLLERGKRCPSATVARALIEGLRLNAEVADRLLAEARPASGRDWIPPGAGR